MSQEEGRSTRRSSTSPRWSWRARGRAAVHRGRAAASRRSRSLLPGPGASLPSWRGRKA